jgi:hypothetical protein
VHRVDWRPALGPGAEQSILDRQVHGTERVNPGVDAVGVRVEDLAGPRVGREPFEVPFRGRRQAQPPHFPVGRQCNGTRPLRNSAGRRTGLGFELKQAVAGDHEA